MKKYTLPITKVEIAGCYLLQSVEPSKKESVPPIPADGFAPNRLYR